MPLTTTEKNISPGESASELEKDMLQAFEEQEVLSLQNIPTHHPQHTFWSVQLEAA